MAMAEKEHEAAAARALEGKGQAVEEKKMLLTNEVSQKEQDLKMRQVRESPGEMVPTDLLPCCPVAFVVREVISTWFEVYAMALCIDGGFGDCP
ncbi:hypothetical protein NDU88_002803 [Pleurodeles waltl]|uniref:Uncharacterized protein n=1 Tax=Pleurodeles waltl TaxID=8319 RepID=A0AAV7TP53_PLEWA|nr:hypothetical protein NDU88_002803 [Pleurodeles waltl]